MTKLEPTQERDLALAIARLERTEDDVKAVLENLRHVKELSYLRIGAGLTYSGEYEKEKEYIFFNSEEKEKLHGIVIAWLKEGFTTPPYEKAIYTIIEKLGIAPEDVRDYNIKPHLKIRSGK